MVTLIVIGCLPLDLWRSPLEGVPKPPPLPTGVPDAA
jgi:hypothetical protein